MSMAASPSPFSREAMAIATLRMDVRRALNAGISEEDAYQAVADVIEERERER